MSQILLAFCLQKKLKVFDECLITEKKRSGFEGVTHGKAMCVIQLTGIVNYIKTDYLSNTIY